MVRSPGPCPRARATWRCEWQGADADWLWSQVYFHKQLHAGNTTNKETRCQRNAPAVIYHRLSELIGGSLSTAAPYPAVSTSRHPSAIPWYIWLGIAAITSSSIGGAWDVSWHRSIGRDSFWTPAHMAIYACGVVAAIICAWLVVKC